MNLLRPRSNRTKVQSEIDGTLAGFQTEHWSDAVDANVIAPRAYVRIPPGGFSLAPFGHLFRTEDLRSKMIEYRGRKVPVIAGGAFSVSGLYVENFIDILDATQLAIDLSLTTHKIAMYTNTLTPDYGVDTAYSATNEVAANGDYAAGGKVVNGPTVTESPTGTLMYDLGDQVWNSPTTVTARGAIEYADALAGNNLIVGITFGSDFTSTAGTFTIQWNSLGVFTIDLTP